MPKLTFKRSWIGNTLPDGLKERLFEAPVRLYSDGVAIGDYYKNVRTSECNVMFFMFGSLSRSFMLGAISVSKAREMLKEYAMTGQVPHPDGLTQEALLSSSTTVGGSVSTGSAFMPFSGILDDDKE